MDKEIKVDGFKYIVPSSAKIKGIMIETKSNYSLIIKPDVKK